MNSAENLSQCLEKLAQKKVLFAHHSVGRNIISGLKLLQKELASTQLSFVEADGLDDLNNNGFYSIHPGGNGNPYEKIREFDAFFRKIPRGTVDIAFLKLCYVDINHKNDATKVLETYKHTFDQLTADYPNTRFLHFTVPLTPVNENWKTKLKKLAGKHCWEHGDNVYRNRYNKKLVSTFPAQTVFDIADKESTPTVGNKTGFTFKGHFYPSMMPEIAERDGHLNSQGQTLIARDLLGLLCRFA